MWLVLSIALNAGLVGWLVYVIHSHRKRTHKYCVCGHGNNVHRDGKGDCLAAYGISEQFPKGSSCACDVFIEKAAPKPPKDKAARELEKMVGL